MAADELANATSFAGAKYPREMRGVDTDACCKVTEPDAGLELLAKPLRDPSQPDRRNVAALGRPVHRRDQFERQALKYERRRCIGRPEFLQRTPPHDAGRTVMNAHGSPEDWGVVGKHLEAPRLNLDEERAHVDAPIRPGVTDPRGF
jgi:hypothetical protein